MSWTDCLTIVSEKLPTTYGCVTCVHSDFIRHCSQDNAAWYNVHSIVSFFTWWPVCFTPEDALLFIVSWEADVQLRSGSVILIADVSWFMLNLAPSGIRYPDCPARGELLYRLSYHGQYKQNTKHCMWWNHIMCYWSFNTLVSNTNYLPTYLTNCLTPCNRVLPEKLTVPQLVKTFRALCGTQRFITAFTSVLHLSISWARATNPCLPIPFLEDPI